MKKYYFFNGSGRRACSWLCLLLWLATLPRLSAQTTLATGDLVFVGYNASDDQVQGANSNEKFSFVLLKNVTAGTRIYFTDYGWLTGGGFQKKWVLGPENGGSGTGSKDDGILSWTATAPVVAGTQITILPKYALGASQGTAAGEETVSGQSYYLNLSDIAGDQLFAYQASSARGANPTLLAGLMILEPWSASLTNNEYTPSRSTLPAALSAGGINAALNIFSPVFELNFRALSIYNCSTNLGFPRTLRNAINTTTNWRIPGEGTDCAGYLYQPDPAADCYQPGIPAGFDLPISCLFTVLQVRILQHPVSQTVCFDKPASFSVVAENASTYRWQGSPNGSSWSNLVAGAVYSGVTSTTLTVLNPAGLNGWQYRVLAEEPVEPSSVPSNAATLTVNNPPQNLTFTASGPITCNNPSVMLTAGSTTAGTSFAFSGPSGPITTPAGATSVEVSVLGQYTVTATALNGCLTTTTVAVTEDKTPPQGASLVASGSLNCNTPSVTLTAAATASTTLTYAFYDNGGNLIPSSNNTATVSQAGNYSVVITAANGCSVTAFAQVTADPPPPAPDLTNRTVNEGDPDVVLQATNCAGTLHWTDPHGNPGTGPITVTTAVPGTFTYTATCQVNGCSSAATVVTVTVTPVNHAPILAHIPDQEVNEGTLLSFSATATDADIPPPSLSFTLTGAPAGAAINLTSGVFSWTPAENQDGAYTVTVVVSDGDLTDQQAVTITVKEVNTAPVLPAISQQEVNEGAILSFQVPASDADLPANTLTYALVNPPAGADIDPATGAFSWTPGHDQVGQHVITIRVTDNGVPPLTAEAQVTVTVRAVSYTLTTTAVGNGTITRNPNLTAYATGSMVTLTANPMAGSAFTGWSGDASGTQNPLVVVMDRNKNITATFRQQQQQQVLSFSLINSKTDQVIRTLNTLDLLNIATLPSRNVNIRANTNPATVGSVKFALSGSVTKNVIENEVPYALYGDNNGNYNDWYLQTGFYLLTATPYTLANAKGTAGTPLTIGFMVINHAWALAASRLVPPQQPGEADKPQLLRVFPNPTQDGRITVQLTEAVQGKVTYTLLSSVGRKIAAGSFSLANPSSLLEFDFSGQLRTTGIYYLRLEGTNVNKVLKLMRD